MGKAGKARKKQKLDRELSAQDALLDDNSISCLTLSEKIDVSIRVFNVLSRRLDVFGDKKFKHLRTALFPLFEAQRNKFFENDVLLSPALTEDAVDAVLSPCNITIAIEVAAHFSLHLDEFNDTSNKPYRKAMHPLVIYKKHEVVQQCGDAVTDGKNSEPTSSLSNRISSCLRVRDWVGALAALRELEKTPDVMPKLGIYRRLDVLLISQ